MAKIKSTAPTRSFFDTKAAEMGLVAALGGVAYCGLEVLWRGWTHFSMGICGAVCLCTFYRFEQKLNFRRRPLALRALLGGIVITGVEFAAGCIVNLALKLDVWDYSANPFQLLGQICLPMSLLWVMLSLGIFPLCDLIRRRIFLSP
ncbi:MAG: putative ABC transporter permease [Clostridia bacterium]|nr:putative ABC transporter permease [Clostridia bacterium]